jgi:nitrite reductase/ring-hydroxylating ferredoxin subunit
MTYDSLPFIGPVDKNLFICTGFNKWGNTNGTIASVVISDYINGKKNKYMGLFNSKRGLSFDKVKNLFLYNIEVGSRYVINKICSNKSYYGNDVRIEYINGRKCGVYIDSDRKKHIVSNICPHMKCNLIFNYIDKTWDCPCHASRFSIDGDILFGPGTNDIKI